MNKNVGIGDLVKISEAHRICTAPVGTIGLVTAIEKHGVRLFIGSRSMLIIYSKLEILSKAGS